MVGPGERDLLRFTERLLKITASLLRNCSLLESIQRITEVH